MAKTKTEMLEEVLKEFIDAIGTDVIATVIATKGGEVISAQSLGGHLNAKQFAALGAMIIGTAEKLSKYVGGEEVEDSVVKYAGENIIVKPVGKKAIFVVVVRSGAYMGLIDLEVKSAVEKIEEILM